MFLPNRVNTSMIKKLDMRLTILFVVGSFSHLTPIFKEHRRGEVKPRHEERPHPGTERAIYIYFSSTKLHSTPHVVVVERFSILPKLGLGVAVRILIWIQIEYFRFLDISV